MILQDILRQSNIQAVSEMIVTMKLLEGATTWDGFDTIIAIHKARTYFYTMLQLTPALTDQLIWVVGDAEIAVYRVDDLDADTDGYPWFPSEGHRLTATDFLRINLETLMGYHVAEKNVARYGYSGYIARVFCIALKYYEFEASAII